MLQAREKINQAKNALVELEQEFAKFEKGNAAAGTRVRKHAQTMRQAMSDLRVIVQSKKNFKE